MAEKNGTGKKVNRGGRQKKNSKPVHGFTFKEEAVLLLFLAVSLILFLGNFGLAGGVDTGGNWLSKQMRGLLGTMEYIFPIVFFISVCFCIVNKKNRQIYIKTAVVYLAMIDISALIQTLRGNDFENLFEQGKNHILAGGVIGGSIAKLLYSSLSLLGTMVVLIVILMGCIVFLTEISFVNGVEKQGKRAYNHTKEGMRRHRDEQEARRKQQWEQRNREEQIRRKQQLEEEQMFDAQQEEERKRKAKIARQMAYMEKEEQKRKARERKYKKKKYVNANGMDIVTLKQPETNKKVDEAQKDIHEIFPGSLEENREKDDKKQGTAASFTIQRGGEVSKVNINGDDVQFDTVPEDGKEVPETLSGKEFGSMSEHAAQNKKAAVKPEQTTEKKIYQMPDIGLLKKCGNERLESKKSLTNTGIKLQNTLQSFGVRVSVSNISCGPSVTRYELQPEQGVKVSKIVGLADDIKLNLAVEDIRIEAPIPGKAAVGIEVPNKKPSPVLLGDLLDSDEFKNSKSSLSFAVGKDISGKIVVHDVAKMPHLLIAGATGSGKSVCINTLIMSILYKANPDKVKLIMVDPKVVELSVYNGIPHMLIPVVTDPKKAAGALNWAVMEMTERYEKMAQMQVRNIEEYNAKLEKIPDSEEKPAYLPQIVVIVDELADLMMVSKSEVEDAICRLAQLARAAGIHLVIATQRPSVDVITGLIKANMPSRIALSVSSGVDSRTIIDINGAEKLLGKGDMLFYPSGFPKPVRVQGAYISDDEVNAVAAALRSQNGESVYNSEIEDKIAQSQQLSTADTASDNENKGRYDDYFVEAGKFVIEKDKGSIGMLQRMFRVGFNRAARIMDQLEEAGVVGAEEGTKPRRVLMSMEEFENFVEECV